MSPNSSPFVCYLFCQKYFWVQRVWGSVCVCGRSRSGIKCGLLISFLAIGHVCRLLESSSPFPVETWLSVTRKCLWHTVVRAESLSRKVWRPILEGTRGRRLDFPQGNSSPLDYILLYVTSSHFGTVSTLGLPRFWY